MLKMIRNELKTHINTYHSTRNFTLNSNLKLNFDSAYAFWSFPKSRDLVTLSMSLTYIGQVAHQNMIRTKRINWYIIPITDPRTKTSWPWWLISFWFLKYLSAEGSKDIWNQVPWIFINSAIFQTVMTVQWWKFSWCHQFSGPRHQLNKMIQNFFTWFKRSFRTLFYFLLWSQDF